MQDFDIASFQLLGCPRAEKPSDLDGANTTTTLQNGNR